MMMPVVVLYFVGYLAFALECRQHMLSSYLPRIILWLRYLLRGWMVTKPFGHHTAVKNDLTELSDVTRSLTITGQSLAFAFLESKVMRFYTFPLCKCTFNSRVLIE